MFKFRYNNKNIKELFLEKKGVASIEFAILFFPFFLLIIILIETLILSYQVAIVDYLTNAGAKHASSYSKLEDYNKKYKDYIDKYEKYFFHFIEKNNLILELEYCKNIDEIEKNACSNEKKDHKVILYSLKYKIKPIFINLRLVNRGEYITRTAIYYSEKKDLYYEN